jgi:hypothetical protein
MADNDPFMDGGADAPLETELGRNADMATIVARSAPFSNARTNLLNQMSMNLYVHAVPRRTRDLMHQYSLWGGATRTEQHYFRMRSFHDMNAMTGPAEVLSTIEDIFRQVRCLCVCVLLQKGYLPVKQALSIFQAVANAFASSPLTQGRIAPMAPGDYVQFRMYTRRGDGDIGNNPTYVQAMVTGGIVTSLLRWGDLTLGLLMALLTDKFQSAETWVLDGNTVIVVTVVRAIHGAGRTVFTGDLNHCQSVVHMRRDTFCAARALVYLRARLFGTTSDLKRVRCFTRKAQYDDASALQARCGIPVNERGVSVTDLDKFASELETQIFVVDDYSVRSCEFMYKTGTVFEKKCVLYYEDTLSVDRVGHFSAVTKVHTMFGCRGYCLDCETQIRGKDHVCGVSVCCICKSVACDVTQPFVVSDYSSWRHCQECNRKFPTPKCFSEHMAIGTCARVWRCTTCNIMCRGPREKHACGKTEDVVCMHCREPLLAGHVCYIPPMDVREDVGGRCIYFDFETTQYLGPHVVNYAVAMYDNSDDVFSFKTLDAFCLWLFQDEHKDSTVLAHNGKGYDFQFIRSWCLRMNRDVEWIATGLKIMTLIDTALKIRFIDSLNFLPMPLAAFTKTFGLGDSVDGFPLKKGFFPHFFNTPRNCRDWAGAVPELKYFGPSYMSLDKQEQLVKWHAARSLSAENGCAYVLATELHEYCVSDVRLLKAGCNHLRELFLSNTGVDPFQHVTIASTAMSVFRTNYLEPKTVVRDIPLLESSMFSRLRLEWLYYTAMIRGETLTIPDARGSDMIAIGRSPGQIATAYHFMSDMDQGNLALYAASYYNKRKKKQMREIAARRVAVHDKLVEEGFNVLGMWHSTWAQERDEDIDVLNWLNDPVNISAMPKLPLNPRHAFFGGRTNAMKLQYTFNVATGEYGRYDDVCSLYPAANYYDPYPVGLPVRYVRISAAEWLVTDRGGVRRMVCDADVEPLGLFGFIRCTVQCPDDLYHPVLPSKAAKGKLLFDLISPKTGTWTTPELALALSVGYTILEVDEVWDYEKTETLFRGYVANFIRMKQEASGYPDGVRGDPVKEKQFCSAFEDKMGFALNAANVDKNAGKRALSKLLLNSLWGKFGQRINQMQAKTVYSNTQLLKIIEDPRYEISYVTPLTDLATEVGYRMREEFLSTDVKIGCVNIPIAAYTTSHGRIRLYAALHKLGRQVLYYDTDSVVYAVDPTRGDHHTMPLGEYIGEWTDELSGGKIVDTFVAPGPKCYSYVVQALDGSRKIETKVKGFSRNMRNEEQLNHASLQRVVQGMGRRKVATHNPHRIRLVKSAQEPIKAVKETKVMGFTYSKRFILLPEDITANIDTLPFGHKDAGAENNPIPKVPDVVEAAVVGVEEGITFTAAEGHVSDELESDAEAAEAEEAEESEEAGEEDTVPVRTKKKRKKTSRFVDDMAGCSDSGDEWYDEVSPADIAADRDFIDDFDADHASYLNEWVLHQ